MGTTKSRIHLVGTSGKLNCHERKRSFHVQILQMSTYRIRHVTVRWIEGFCFQIHLSDKVSSWGGLNVFKTSNAAQLAKRMIFYVRGVLINSTKLGSLRVLLKVEESTTLILFQKPLHNLPVFEELATDALKLTSNVIELEVTILSEFEQS